MKLPCDYFFIISSVKQMFGTSKAIEVQTDPALPEGVKRV